MNRTEYLSKIATGGVGTARVAWQTEVKPAAAHKGTHLSKVTRAMVMTGVNYADLAVNANTSTGPLPWGEWAQFPHIITHKGTDYARLYVIDGTVETIYMVDGSLVDRDTFNQYLTPSAAKSNRPKGGTISVKISNIKSVK